VFRNLKRLLSSALFLVCIFIAAATIAPIAVADTTPEWGASYEVQGDQCQWLAGETRTVSLRITNTGTQSWTAGGDQPVQLGVHFGTNSDGWHDGWATDQRFNLPNDVAPGTFIDLTVQVTAPNTAGSYVLRFRMLKEGVTWFDDIHKIQGVSVQGQHLSYALAGITPAAGTPPIPIPGSTWRLNVTVANTGTETWKAAGDGKVRLAIHFVANPDSDNPHERWVTDDRFELTRDVPSYHFDQTNGQITLENLVVNLPRDPGDYTMHIRMVKEGVTWFDQEPSAKLPISMEIPYPPLSYDLVDYTSSGGLNPDGTIRLNLTVRNIGTETWNATGDGRVRLAIHFVADPDSDNPHERWVTDDRFELPRDVPPYVFDQTNGQIKFENLPIHIPRDAGSYTMHIRMVKEGVTWFEQNPNTKFSSSFPGLFRSYAVTNVVASPELTSTIAPGQTISMSVTIANTGTETWNATGDGPVRLGVHFASPTGSDEPHDGWVTDQRWDLTRNVPFYLIDTTNGTITLNNLQVKAPTQPGNYVLRIRMVKEGVSWFSQDPNAKVQVLVDGPIPPPEPDPQWRASYVSSPPTSWVVGQTRNYTVNVTNNGTQSWNASGDNPVHLGIHFGTASDEWHDGWANDLRIDLPHDVAPGQTVAIPVSVTAPADAGSYVLRHRMVKEGVTWFTDIQKTDVSVAAAN
jgi:hypothetical protein